MADQTNILSPQFDGISFSETLNFEFVSWWGRHFRKSKNKVKSDKKPLLLDIGAGGNFVDGWTHADFYLNPRFKFWKKYSKRREPEVELDLRYPINCPTNYVDGIYSGHTLEHLYPAKAMQLLREMYRILKPGCFLRINVPDLEKYVNFYQGKESHENFHEFQSGCEAISVITQNYGHHSAWDEVQLVKTLQLIGFVMVKRVKFGKEGTDVRLIKEESVREWETIVVEAQKPDK